MEGLQAIHKIMLDFGNEVVVFWIDKEPYRMYRNQIDTDSMQNEDADEDEE